MHWSLISRRVVLVPTSAGEPQDSTIVSICFTADARDTRTASTALFHHLSGFRTSRFLSPSALELHSIGHILGLLWLLCFLLGMNL